VPSEDVFDTDTPLTHAKNALRVCSDHERPIDDRQQLERGNATTNLDEQRIALIILCTKSFVELNGPECQPPSDLATFDGGQLATRKVLPTDPQSLGTASGGKRRSAEQKAPLGIGTRLAAVCKDGTLREAQRVFDMV
jgi:hypothetical protein